MNRRLAPLAIALGATMLLAACNKSEEAAMERMIEEDTGGEADVDMRADGTMRVETDEGTWETGGDVPSDWPEDVAVYADAKVQTSASVNPQTGKPGNVLILMTTDSAADVAAFYSDSLKDEGWAVEGTMNMGPSTIIGASKDGRNLAIMIAEDSGQTMITIGIEKGE